MKHNERKPEFITVGKVSLWFVPEDKSYGSTVATGMVDLTIEGRAEPVKARIYIHQGEKRKSSSPDMYGYIKTEEAIFGNPMSMEEHIKKYKPESKKAQELESEDDLPFDDE